MLSDMYDALTRQGDRISGSQTDSADRVRETVSQELTQTRAATHALQLAQTLALGASREDLIRQLSGLSTAMQEKHDALRTDMLTHTLQKLAEYGRADQQLIQATMAKTTEQLIASGESLTRKVDERLNEISGRVSERLDEGFKKTNETFVNVMARLATIDEAQKKIDGLTTNVVGLQELLGDKRARGAFGEVQLEALVRNVLPAQAYSMQYTLSNGKVVDCVLRLPEPTGMVAVDSKFPLENYHRMFSSEMSLSQQATARKQFKVDVKAHVDAISSKYMIAGETSDGAVMFIPAEAVFAEIHGYHGDVVDYAMQKRVWIVSPTTLMAVLNTARAVIKDVEMRKQIHIIKDELGKLGKDFNRFEERMKLLAKHIRLANDDAEEVHKSSQKISKRFAEIDRVELEPAAVLPTLRLVEGDQDE